MKISAVIIVKNEEEHLAEALESLSFADEIIVVDDNSSDKTIAIAKRYTKKIYTVKGTGYVEPLREFAVSKAKNNWIFMLDADERVPATLVESLKNLSEDISAVFIPRKNIIFDSWIQYAGWWPDYNVRFFKKDHVIWSSVIHSQPEIKGKKEYLNPSEDNAIIHYNYNSITQFIEKLNRYTSVQAHDLIEKKDTLKWQDIFSQPVKEFLSRYFAQEGYKEGLHGLILSTLMGIYIYIVYLKVWEEQGFQKEQQNNFLSQFYILWNRLNTETLYWFSAELAKKTINPFKKEYYKLRQRYLAGKLKK